MIARSTVVAAWVATACLVTGGATLNCCAQSGSQTEPGSNGSETTDRPLPPDLPQPASSDVPPVAAAPAEIQQWVAGLDDELFDVRESSQAKLSRAGTAAILPLERAAEGGSLEQTSRAVRALGSIGQTGEIATFEGVQDSLEKLARSKNRAVARRAVLELDRLGEARTRHAIAKFEALGGRMKRARAAVVAPGNIPELRRPQAVLNRNWKGTDDDLVLLTRISGLDALYVTKSAPVSPEALEKLRRAMPPAPQFQIQPRGDAMVGISALSQEDGCVVQSTEEGSPAEKAGLKAGDVILTYNGTKLDSFEKLVEITRELNPGTRVALEIMRRETIQTVELELGDFE